MARIEGSSQLNEVSCDREARDISKLIEVDRGVLA